MTRFARRLGAPLVALALGATSAVAGDLYQQNTWSALASDRTAADVGDSLTVLVIENSVATNSAQNSSDRDSRIAGQAAAGSTFDESARLGLAGAFEGRGQTGRSGRMAAQLSVVVDSILPNGDLHVSGNQVLSINGERSRIRLSGRVRRADVTSSNTVLSSRLADVVIDYDGAGFVADSARPGIVTRIFNWLRLP